MDPSREGLLSPSAKERQAHSSDSDTDSDLDVTEFLDHDPLNDSAAPPANATRAKNTQYRDRKAPLKPAFLRSSSSAPSRLCCCFRRPRSRCCIVALVVVGTFWLIAAGGGLFVYKKFKDEPPYGQSPPWYPSPLGGTASGWADAYARAAELVTKMTLPEKVNITTGTGWQMGLAVGNNAPATGVGFPQLALQDGPLGLRFADNATAFPAGITVAATWNRNLAFLRGKAHGTEARDKGINALLGPVVGPLGRMPAGGRNWEGFGADPYLQGVAAAETIRGIQSEGVMAVVKHFVGNEQEHFRQPWEWALPHSISANIGDRALHEIYAWPFGDAVRAGVAGVMCSYNMVNNSYACANSKLLNGVLKSELGFQGFVVSDWLAQHSGVASAIAGLDMTMPGDGLKWADGKSLWGPELTRSVLNGSVPVERINDMVTRIVAAYYKLGQDYPLRFDGEGPNFSSWSNEKMGVLSPGSPSPQEQIRVNAFRNVMNKHSNVARDVAIEGTVLLKNHNCLPFSRKGWTDARRALAESVGRRHDGHLKIGIFGEDAGPGKGPNFCMDRACNQGTLGSGWGSGAVEFPYLVPPVDTISKGFEPDTVIISSHVEDNKIPSDTAAPEAQDVCLVFASADAGEGYLADGPVKGDRPDLLLQKGGEELVHGVASRCGNGTGETIVVIHSVGPVTVEKWIDLPTVRAVVWANLPGQESGNALADILFGDANPSGHLPYTIGKSLADYGPQGQVMYLPNGVAPQQDFAEGFKVDYRHFDAAHIEPRFPFGFGLSYTSFAVDNVTVTGLLPKSPSPAAVVPSPAPAAPPSYSTAIPNAEEALWPPNFRALEKYIYPYLDSTSDIVSHAYPYPDGYSTTPHAPEPANPHGEEGGDSDLWTPYVRVSASVTNTGAVPGKAVPQLYMSYPDVEVKSGSGEVVEFPVKVLRGFEKIMLQKGESRSVDFNVTRRDLSFWDVESQNWRMVVEGKYVFRVGFSADERDLGVGGSW